MIGVAVHGAPLSEQLTYAKALSSSGLLPAQYRGNPANLLFAISYAEMLGCHPLTAVTGIHVIEGKPSASAALISALVRRAGHKLRVTGDTKSATCQIVRCDDPDFTFEVTWTMDDAKAANLAGKGVWKSYPASMLKARAITQCARDACEDALSGLHYTAEELGAEVVGEDAAPVAQVTPARQIEHGPLTEDPWAIPALPAAAPAGPGLDELAAEVLNAESDAALLAIWNRASHLGQSDAAELRDLIKGRKAALADIAAEGAVESEPVELASAPWPEVPVPGGAR